VSGLHQRHEGGHLAARPRRRGDVATRHPYGASVGRSRPEVFDSGQRTEVGGRLRLRGIQDPPAAIRLRALLQRGSLWPDDQVNRLPFQNVVSNN